MTWWSLRCQVSSCQSIGNFEPRLFHSHRLVRRWSRIWWLLRTFDELAAHFVGHFEGRVEFLASHMFQLLDQLAAPPVVQHAVCARCFGLCRYPVPCGPFLFLFDGWPSVTPAEPTLLKRGGIASRRTLHIELDKFPSRVRSGANLERGPYTVHRTPAFLTLAYRNGPMDGLSRSTK